VRQVTLAASVERNIKIKHRRLRSVPDYLPTLGILFLGFGPGLPGAVKWPQRSPK
jgi:hypothetical protein